MAQKVFEEEKQPLSTPEIWQIAVAKGYDQLIGSTGKTPWVTLGAQMYIQVRRNPASIWGIVRTRPK